ncbi:hypothetical protein ACJRO7_027826 [Eucalyptus globulus]|uniref:Uncharacterized protein n=1 Tax=Eucalyptus globulus TaxID=34317 RepID=A0ABD3JUY0_EUCGL
MDVAGIQMLLEGGQPDTTAALAFGLMAAQRHGADVTLWQGHQGRGNPYRTLLREGTTALLSSYKSIQFPYHTLGMIQDMTRPGWARHRTSSSRRYASGGPTLGK